MNGGGNHPPNWRDFQKDLRRAQTRNALRERLPFFGVWIGFLVVVFSILGYTGSWIFAHLSLNPHPPERKVQEAEKRPVRISRGELPQVLADLDIGSRPAARNYTLQRNGSMISVETTLLPPLQGYLQDLLRKSLTVRASAVVLRPSTGEVLAFSDYRNGKDGENRDGENGNLWLRADHPAASLFKIVSAAAAIDARGMTPDTSLVFRGGKYTLYRSQLKPEKKPSGMRISLTKAFSSSVNPVFGRIGIYHLGYSLVTEYADRFFFNRPIPFDLPLEVSLMEVPADDFALAEVASGFNKRTFISPLHAAMLAGAVANGGTMMGPIVIRKIEDGEGNLAYGSSPVELANPVTEDTARKMKILMEETVATGTCRSAFRKHLRKSEFRDLELGAKTGSINDPSDQYRVDWVSAYAIPDSGEEDAICLSVLAVHGERLGIRSKDIARRLVENYFGS
jgi:cell division protein FtsI/penicillin-binding protein 2